MGRVWASGRQPHWGHLHAPEPTCSPAWAGPAPGSLNPGPGIPVFSQPAPPHLIAFQSANSWPTPSTTRRATSVWPAVASRLTARVQAWGSQPLGSPCPNPSSSPSPYRLTFPKQGRARSSPDRKRQTDSSSVPPYNLPLPPPRLAISWRSGENNSKKWSRTYCSIPGANCFG